MTDILTHRLRRFTDFRCEEISELRSWTESGIREYSSRQDIVTEGANDRNAVLVLSGWAYRYKILIDGRRQILSLCLPGDIESLEGSLGLPQLYSLASITAVRIAAIPFEMIVLARSSFTGISYALAMDAAVNAAVQDQRAITLGSRNAVERMAHFLCEMWIRTGAAGLANGPSAPFPLTQTDIGDVLGLTSVHVNRMLRQLRELGLVAIAAGEMTMNNFKGLQQIAQFDPRYLLIGKREA